MLAAGITERHEVGGLFYGIGSDGLGEYAQCRDAKTGERLESPGPCLDTGFVRFMLAAVMLAGVRDGDAPAYGRRPGG